MTSSEPIIPPLHRLSSTSRKAAPFPHAPRSPTTSARSIPSPPRSMTSTLNPVSTAPIPSSPTLSFRHASTSRIPLLASSPRAPLLRSMSEYQTLSPPALHRITTASSERSQVDMEKETERKMKQEREKWSGIDKFRDGQPASEPKLILEKMELYETKTMFYVVASNSANARYRVLKIDRSLPPPINSHSNGDDGGLHVTEDSMIYTHEEVSELLTTLGAGNVGGIHRSDQSFQGIAGFVRFTSTYYMILIKSRAPVALIGGHYIYHVEETVLKPISVVSGGKSSEENRMMASFLGVDMSKNFYFSYTYDITHTLQHNFTKPPHDSSHSPTALSTFNDKFVWNQHLLRPAFFETKAGSPWILPLIHGFVDQAKLLVFGKTVYITLLARRSRHFAGARFWKRGINDQGYVANDVETEQIVSESLTTAFHLPITGDSTDYSRKPNPRFTSFIQVRGSIPLYWAQESTNMSPKPPIEFTIVDPFFSAAALHFDDLLGRYGGPITVLNLIKHKERAPRESKLLPEFKQCIDYLNQFLPTDQRLNYIAWDIAAINKQQKDVIGILSDIAEDSITTTGFFHSGPEPTWYALNGDDDYRATPLLQSGVIRTNCIDCLDRTNAAQFVVAKAALGHQLHALGIIHHPQLPFDCDAINLITEMLHDHGDTIAWQYGGSLLVNTLETYRRNGAWTSHSRDTIENLRRYWSNSFVDADKQAAMDLFLGVESATGLPTPPPYSVPRRSYIDWFTPSHLLSTPADLSLSEKVMRDSFKGENMMEYWQMYYRPKLLTEMTRHFAWKMNSTDKWSRIGGVDASDLSPFVPRGLRSAAPGSSAENAAKIRPSEHYTRELSSPDTLKTPIERHIAQLLSPSVDLAELREYDSYIHQFDSLSLSLTDLTSKDKSMYERAVDLSRGSDLNHLSVEKSNERMYAEAVKVCR